MGNTQRIIQLFIKSGYLLVSLALWLWRDGLQKRTAYRKTPVCGIVDFFDEKGDF